MHKNINRVVTVLLLSVLSGSITPALAVEAPTAETPATTNEPMVQDSGGFVLYGALTFGGDTLATASNEDGDDVDLDAGGLFHLALGYEKRLGWGGIRATLGYKFDTLDADNGDAEITRFPLEAVVYKSFGERHRLGGGLVHELSPQYELSIDGLGSNTFDFEDATGFVAYYGYSIGALEWGARYTIIEYKPELSFIEDVDADNFGLYVSSFFD
jgi:hypothetical protein